MDGRPTLIWLLIICWHSSGWVSGSFHGIQSGRRELTDRKGFISIDCGIAPGSHYTDDGLLILYVSDEDFIDTGINYNVSKEYIDDDALKQFMSVRSFPEGNKNCYTLRPEGGKDNKYLIRARFKYGNYDSNNELPKFKLYLGADEWATVNITNASRAIREEIIHVPKTDDIYVCLVNIGSGTPFISSLELRPLDNSSYDHQTETESLLLFNRWDFGAEEVYYLIRVDDVYDRIWDTFNQSQWGTLKAPYESSSFSNSEYKLPAEVMMDAVTPADISDYWSFSLVLDDDPSQNLYIYMHFAEVVELGEGDIREFTVSLNGDDSWGGGEPVIPKYMVSNTLHNPSAVSGSTTNPLSFALKRTHRSTLPPIINAMEVYRTKAFSQSSTNQDDVVAVKNIRLAYGLTRHWQGDPCLPLGFPWDGLQCSDSSDSPTIISLNLSSSNLTGNIHPSFSKLQSLENLDLSYNNLTGTVPKFFADLPSLMVLNLTGNQLTGSIPQTVMERFKGRTLSLGENPNLCLSVSCQGKKKKKKKKNRFLVPVLIAIPTVVVILILITALAMIIRKFQRRETKDPINASSISANLNNIPVLNSTNFGKWKENIIIVLGCMDLDYAIRSEKPPAPTDSSTREQMALYEKWERSNRMSLMIMKHSIPDTIRSAMPEEENAKSFLSQITDRFVGNEKVETSIILSKLVSMQYNNKGNIREYIMEMSNLVTRLRALKLELSDDILVHLVLISLPAQFSSLKISYNTQKEKWTLNELIAQCVQEEGRLKEEKIESAHLANSSNDNAVNKKRKINNKLKEATDDGTSLPKV